MESKNKLFVKARLEGKSVEEAATIAGISDQELVSARRAESGAKGGASKKRIEIQDQLRRKHGKEYEERLAAIRAEEKIPPDGWDKTITKFNWHELMHRAEEVLLGIGYNRKYPPSSRDEFFDVLESQWKQPEELKIYFDTYPEYACLDMVGWLQKNHLTDGLRKLVIWTFEEFINWESANNQFVHESDLQTIKRALLDLQQGKDLYDPPLEEPVQSSPEPDPRQHPAYIRDSQVQLERVTFFQTAESKAQAEEARRIEADIHQKHLEAQRLIDQERLRNLPMDAIRFLQEGR